MVYSVKITNQASEDLKSLYEYIALELNSFENAEAQLSRLEENILNLKDMPYRFKAYEQEPWKTRGLRTMPVDNYLVFYIPNDDTQTVTVIRVMYGRRNTLKQLND